MWSLHSDPHPGENPLAHPHKGTLAGVGDDFEAVHEGLHDGKAHAAAFLLRLGGIKGFHGQRNIGDTPAVILDFHGYFTAFVIAGAQR